MGILEAILLGVVQGLTEFLPISSSAHLVIAQHFIKGFQQPGILFDVALHLGTLVAVLIFFQREIIEIIKDIFNLNHKDNSDQIYLINFGGGKRLALFIIIGTVPTALIGYFFEAQFIRLFSAVSIVGFMLIINGFILFFSEIYNISKRERKNLNILNSLAIGIVQGISIIPGISRSGSTISAGLFFRFDPDTATKFSFLLSIPAVLGAVILNLRHVSQLSNNEFNSYLMGFIVSLIFGLLSIKMLTAIIRKKRFRYFAFYCWTIGILTILLL